MAVESRADRAAWLLLWHLREPARFRNEQLRDARPPDAETVLKLALGRRVALTDPTLAQVGTATLRDAAATYVRRQFFRSDATPYQTLGLPPFASDRAIKASFRLLMQLVHPDRQQANGAWPDSFAAEANRAYAVLRDVNARSRLDGEEKARAARANEARRSGAPPEHRRPPVANVVRRRPPPAALPEWLTAGVGGFARAHPAVVAFAALIAVATLSIGIAAWEGQDTALTRDSPGRAGAASTAAATNPADPAVVAATAVLRQEPQSPPVAPPLEPSAGRDVPSAGRAASLVVPAPAEAGRLPPTARPDAVGVPARAASPAPSPSSAIPRADLMQPPIVANSLPVEPVEPPAAAATALADALQPRVVPTMPAAEPVSRPVANAVPLAAAAATPQVQTASVQAPVAPVATSRAPTTDEIEGLFVALVDAYQRGRADSLAALFADDVQAGERHGRAAIRLEYDDVFRRSEWRRMQLTRVTWRPTGDAAEARAEAAVRIGWRDGREVEQRIAMDVEIARRGGRVVITRMSRQAGAP